MLRTCIKHCMFPRIGFYCLGFLLLPSLVLAKPLLSIQHWKNKQGINVYFSPTHQTPMLDVAVLFNAGSVRDGQQYGLAQLTANNLSEGSTDLSAEQVSEKFERVGAQYGVEVGRDSAAIDLRTLTASKALSQALIAFNKVLTQPVFPADNLARIKKQTLVMLRSEQQVPAAVATKTFMHLLYGQSPYAHSPSGTPSTLAKLSNKDLKHFYQQYYVMQNADIVLVGNIDRQKAGQIANMLLQGMPVGQAAKNSIQAAPTTVATTKHIDLSVPQTAIVMGGLGIAAKNPNRFALVLGNKMLGGGMSSELFKVVREQHGLSYNISSQFAVMLSPGPFLVRLQTSNQNAVSAAKLTKQVLARFVSSPPSAQALRLAKQSYINALPMRLNSNQQLMQALSQIALYHLPLNYFDQLAGNIQKVSAVQIQQALKQYVRLNQMITVYAGRAVQ